MADTDDRLRVDLLHLDLETCVRCRGTARNLESALETARELLATTGTEIELNRIHVESAEQARALRFESSPTIRVNGRDIALELRESACGSEPCTDGCGGSIACRVWVHRGLEYTEAPVAMVLDAILREAYGGVAVEEPVPYRLSDNLERFFAGKAAAQEAACCPPAEQRSCCDPEEKPACCGGSGEERCGCG